MTRRLTILCEGTLPDRRENRRKKAFFAAGAAKCLQEPDEKGGRRGARGGAGKYGEEIIPSAIDKNCICDRILLNLIITLIKSGGGTGPVMPGNLDMSKVLIPAVITER